MGYKIAKRDKAEEGVVRAWISGSAGVAVVLLAGVTAASAQAVASAPAAPSPTTAPQPPAPGKNDVVVTGKRTRPCGERDQACIQDVVAEAWRKYPEKVDAFCVREQWRIMQQHFTAEAIAEGGAFGAASDSNYATELPPAERALCEYGDKLRAEKKAAEQAAKPAPVQPAKPSM